MILIAPGGIGNQLFTVAAALHISENTSQRVKVYSDQRELVAQYKAMKINSISRANVRIVYSKKKALFILQVCTKIIFLTRDKPKLSRFILKRLRIMDKPWEFPFDSLDVQKPRMYVLLGFFQDIKLIDDLSEESALVLMQILNLDSDKMINLKNNKLRLIGAHVRRGDYISIPEYGILTEKYFRDLIDIQFQEEDHMILIASEDNELLRRIGKYKRQLLLTSQIYSPLETMKQLARSEVFIMSNSTFSFWIGWAVLRNGGSVYAPTPWFRSTYTPPDFLKLSGFTLVEAKFE